jgi:hypothetical protein
MSSKHHFYQSAADIPGGQKFDVLYTAMAFHHMPDPKAATKLFFDLLKPVNAFARVWYAIYTSLILFSCVGRSCDDCGLAAHSVE